MLSARDAVFRSYLFHASVLIFKMIAMSFLTIRQRFKNKAFMNPEDARSAGSRVTTVEKVERIRRAHQNDVANIPIFLIAAFMYQLTDPNPQLAMYLFKVYTAARITHTVVYAIYVVPQPARFIAWLVGTAVTLYMSVQCVIYTL